MGLRGPQAGDIANKVKAEVPVTRGGRTFVQEKWVTRKYAEENGLKIAENQGAEDVYAALAPDDPKRMHSHYGKEGLHSVQDKHHGDDEAQIEHRNEMDDYENKYWGEQKQKPIHEQLGIKLESKVPATFKGRHFTATRMTHPKVGQFYLFEHGQKYYVLSPNLRMLKPFNDKLQGWDFIESYVANALSQQQKSLILKGIDRLVKDVPQVPQVQESGNAFSSYASGNNQVSMNYDGQKYDVKVNGQPVQQTEDMGRALSEYYRQIGELIRFQESDPDIALNVFGDQVVRTNRAAIEKLSMMGKSSELKMLKNFDYSKIELPYCDILKFDPPSNCIGQVPVQEEQGQATNEIGVKPRRLEYHEQKKVGPNTVLLKEEKPMKIDEKTARKIGDEIGVEWDKVDFGQFHKGINVEMEHGSVDPQTDVIGNNLSAAGKICWAHLKELPDYYSKLERIEKELKDLGMRPAPIEGEQDRHRDIERAHKVSRTYQSHNTPSEEAPIVQKDFPKMTEGDQAHQLIGLEQKEKIGSKPQPIIGKSFCTQKTFSPMMATDRIGDRPQPLDGKDGVANFSTEEQTTAETANQTKVYPNLTDKRHEVETNKEPFYKQLSTDIIYDQIEDIMKSGLIEGSQPIGVKRIGNEVENALYYSLRDSVNNWFGGIEKDTPIDKAIIDLKSSLMKWQISSNRDVTEDVKDIFNKGIQAGIKNTGIHVSDGVMGQFNYQVYKPTGISPAIENFQNSVFDSVSKILRKHYHSENGIPLYRSKRDIDSYLRKCRYKTRLMIKSEVSQMANLGQIIAWSQDGDKDFYEYFWNAVDDDRIKPISKMRAEGNPYNFDTIRYLWENQIQVINGRELNDSYNQRCSISKGKKLASEWKGNKFSNQTHLFKSTMI
jgi:hypothetical protein